MDDIILNVFRQYGLKPVKWKLIKEHPKRSIWKVKTRNGYFGLKSVSENKAKTTSNVSKYLADKGVPIITTLPTLNGDDYVKVDESSFILYHWFEGKAISYDTPGTIERMCTVLSQFHDASRGYGSIGEIRDKTNLLKEYNDRFVMLKELYKKAEVKDDKMATEFKNHYSWLEKRCQYVIESIPQSPYQKLINEAKLDPLIGHGDFARPNILCDKSGNWKIIDLDTLGTSLRIRDISRLITFVNQDLQGWDASRFHSMLEAYNRTHPLSGEELEVLILDQHYPHQGIDLLRRHYIEGGKSFLDRFKLCMETDKKKLAYFGKLNLHLS